MLQLSVECHRKDGDEGGEAFPVRFGWPQAMREVIEVVDWWPGEGHCYFRLRANDGGVYILRHNEEMDFWELVFFERGTAAPVVQAGNSRPD